MTSNVISSSPEFSQKILGRSGKLDCLGYCKNKIRAMTEFTYSRRACWQVIAAPVEFGVVDAGNDGGIDFYMLYGFCSRFFATGFCALCG